MTREKMILDEVTEAFNITIDDLNSRNRKPRLVDARAVVCYLMHYHTSLTSGEIGAMIGRDHSTVLYFVKKVEAMRQWPKMYYFNLRVLEEIEKKLEDDGKVDTAGN